MISRENRETGRTLQKRRTRKALLDAATRLIERGERPRLAAVAREALVSRATAYRYFPSEEALVLEAPMARGFLSPDDVLPQTAPADPAARAVRVQQYLLEHAVEHEREFRTFLRATFDHWLDSGGAPDESLRAGRRAELFERAIEPLRARLDRGTFTRLRLALCAMSGIESLVVIRDVCHASVEEGSAAIAWAVETLVRAAGAEPADRSSGTGT